VPLTIDAYDAVPTLFHSYNPAYYHSYVKNAGFITEHGLVNIKPDSPQSWPSVTGRWSSKLSDQA
jgi:hypothetical protein